MVSRCLHVFSAKRSSEEVERVRAQDSRPGPVLIRKATKTMACIALRRLCSGGERVCAVASYSIYDTPSQQSFSIERPRQDSEGYPQ